MSFPHLIVIAFIALIVLGPEKLPQVARTLGKAMAEFRRITGDFRTTVETEMRELERVTALKELREGFPDQVHYDIQQQREANAETARTAEAPLPPPEFTGAAPVPPAATGEATPSAPTASAVEAGAADTEAAAASGKPSNGHPTSA
jgi:Tat protein translocase TatB subunit